VEISRECLEDSGPDLLQQIQQRQLDALYKRHRADLAAVTTDELAWIAYPPLKSDDPAEYEPYWARLTDVVKDDDEREAIVAAWWNNQR
jgi:hypothetical protein